jgi:hypothetical protein
MKLTISERGRLYVCALTCVIFVIISTISKSQVSDPQSQGLVVKADAESLCALVGKMQMIAVRYGYDPATAEPRELEPYAVGYTRARNILLFARQLKGYSKSADSGLEKLPGWRNFRIDRVKNGIVNALVSTFNPVQPDLSEQRAISEFVCKNEAVR